MESPKLLPNEVRSPGLLIGVHVLSQGVLALVLWRAWALVSGELQDDGRRAYFTLFAMQAALVLAAVLVGLWLWRRSARVQGAVALLFFLLNVAFLWGALVLSANLVPSTVADWMLAPGHMIFALLCMLSPALFHAALCISAHELRLSPPTDIGGSLITLVIIPVGWYFMAGPGNRFFTSVDMPFAVGMGLFVLSTALVTFVFLRLLLWLYRLRRGTSVPLLLGGLLLPFAGLALNQQLPFPVDLQYWPVYVMTAINGLLLLVPLRGTARRRLLTWLARVALLPFSLYFFLLFLPFLPLSIVAMIAAGAGFLVLAPTFLFVLHARLLFDDYRSLRTQWSRASLLGGFVLALMLLPTVYVGRAVWHGRVLMAAVDAVYAPDLARAQPTIRPRATRLALKNLQRMKEGLYLPFLSEVYNGVAFKGMVIPDHKVKTLSEAVCGEDLSQRPERTGRMGGEDLFSLLNTSRNRTRRWGDARPQPRNVLLRDLQLTSLVTNDALVEARVVLDLVNEDRENAEFMAVVDLPPWVRVSGFSLDVEGEWVEGRLFDRKAALWVYHMIRDVTRRDPGLLFYTDAGQLELRVFPFAAAQRRQCTLRLLYPAGEAASLALAGRSLELSPAGGLPAPLMSLPLPSGGTALFVPPGQAVRMPPRRRPTRIHFLIDASAAADSAAQARYASRLTQVLTRHPWATNVAVTAVSFGSLTVAPAGSTPAEAQAALADWRPPRGAAGGFCADLAARRVLFAEITAGEPSSHATAFVVLGAGPQTVIGDLSALMTRVPDALVLEETATVAPEGAPVLLIRAADAWALLPWPAGGWAFSGHNADEAAFIGAASASAPVLEPVARLLPAHPWAAAAAIRQVADTRALYPPQADRQRGALLALARGSGILAPESAYMVVENSAQWRALERAEKQSLGAHEALEFDEFVTPEPEVWLVLAGFTCWLGLRFLSRKRAGVMRVLD